MQSLPWVWRRSSGLVQNRGLRGGGSQRWAPEEDSGLEAPPWALPGERSAQVLWGKPRLFALCRRGGSRRLFIPRGPQKALLSPGGLFGSGLRRTVGPRLAGPRWWGSGAKCQRCQRRNIYLGRYLFLLARVS